MNYLDGCTRKDYDKQMGIVIITRPDEHSVLGKLRPLLAVLTTGRIAAAVEIVASCVLVALTAWFTAFLAGATITKGSVYAGAVGAAGGFHLLASLLMVVIASIAMLIVRKKEDKQSSVRKMAFHWWVASHLFFIVGTVLDYGFVNIHL